jgi:tight adherence protein B
MSMMTTILIVGGGLILLLIVVGLIITTQAEKKFVSERLDRFSRETQEAMLAAKEQKTPLTDWIGTQVSRFSWGQSLSRQLARADLKLRVGEFLSLMLIVGVGLGAIVWFLAGRDILSGVIGLGVGIALPYIYVRNQQGKRLQRFDEQLGDMLSLMVNSLRAGYSTMQALEAVSKELPSPISDEFRRVVQEMQLGITMEATLDNLLRRMPSKDLDLVVTAMNVQREVGGNLAEIMETISHTIRERVRIKGEIRVLVSQVMTSGKFLAAMPIMLTVGMYFLNRNYMMNFFNPNTRWLGIPALILGAVIIVIGYFSMKKIADIEV